MLEEYSKIAEIEKLKKLILSDKQTAEIDLDSFIKEKYKNAEVFRQRILGTIGNQQASFKL